MRINLSRLFISLLICFNLLSSCFSNKVTKKNIRVNIHQEISNLNLVEGSKIATKGFSDPNDKGNAFYIVKSNGIADNLVVIKLRNGNYAHLLPNEDGFINVRQLGAKGKGHILDREAFKKAIQITKKILVPEGNYRIETDVYLDDDIYIKGEKGAIIIGMFLINGKENITIEGLEFRSFNENWNHGIRIREKSARSIRILNCQFNKKSFIFQDYPDNENPIDTLIVDGCSFNFINEGENITITTIQVLAASLFVSNCKFQVKGIDGCIKNFLGSGLMIVSDCEFYGDMDEEILDFYKYTGDFIFTKNEVNISRGGVVRTKPSDDINIVPFFRDCNYEFSHNKIVHTGSNDNLVYFAGYQNLEKEIIDIKQQVLVSHNDLNLKNVNTPFNFRGLNYVECSDNSIKGDNYSNYSIYICGINNLKVNNNFIESGGIVAYQTSAPNSQKYKGKNLSAEWSFFNNTYENRDYKENFILIHNQSGNTNIFIKNNEFLNTRKVVKFQEGSYKSIKFIDNKIKLKPKVEKGNYSPIDMGNSKVENSDIRRNQIIKN